ncbi:3-propionate hydroxylase [Dactylonectria estremocensis]|uniref:3-propionate hydroxylase n=1 Tax=Dactylonectria estremocensis TaxID=1079267 RepID=A0A9P9J712_9HYPO|nr:3-propionate hydroxylase [Dactylonectria estremocensis]
MSPTATFNVTPPSGDPLPPVREEVPVLIIGAGPTGLLGAVLLTKLGVKTLIIERYAQRLTAPKAHAVGPRALEIFRQAGVDIPELRRQGTKRSEGRSVSIVTSLVGEELRNYPYERTDSDVLDLTPEMLHNVPQPNTEQLLAKQLGSTVELRKGHSFVRCSNAPSHVDTVIEDRTTGEFYTIRSKHVLACDGARSKVRQALNIQSDGESTTQTLMTIEISCDLTGVVKERRRILYNILDPVAHGVLIAYDLSRKQVLIHNFDTKLQPVESWNEQKCRDLVEVAIGEKVPLTIDSFRPWVLQRKIASTYRSGNCFLVGDAAHSFPPSAGIGLNTGFGDVHNLAYKIAAVHHGWAQDAILDTYSTERRSVADTNSAQSVTNGLRLHGLVRTLGLNKGDPKEARQRVKDILLNNGTDSKGASEDLDALRSNFNNLELHLGYVYGRTSHPKNASDFQPKFVPGARLPHSWIRPLNDVMRGIPPVDLNHIYEFSTTERNLRQYSTLDLCRLDQFTVITNSSALSIATAQMAKPEWPAACQKGTNLPPLRVVYLGKDFELVFPEKSQDWLDQLHLGQGQVGAVLVRPDQHIVQGWEEFPSAKEFRHALLENLGNKHR